jgi:hypothetical protein
LPENKYKCTDANARFKKPFEDAENELIAAENKKAWIKRCCEGDASETGLIKFIQPLLIEAYACEGGIKEFRENHPVIKDGENQLV